MKNNFATLILSGKALNILRFALIITVLFSLLAFPGFAFAGPIAGGSGG